MKHKESIPLWLERELSDIDQMIGILEAVKSSAFSLSSSPVDVLTRLLVDLLMKIKNSHEHDLPETESLNPAIIFLDDEPMGPLGNSSQRTIKYHSKLNWHPTESMHKLLQGLAVFFSRSIKQDFIFQKDFHDLLKYLAEFLPPGFLSQKSKNAEKNIKNNKPNVAIEANVRAYYRRRSKGK
jgi:hypothetical protein